MVGILAEKEERKQQKGKVGVGSVLELEDGSDYRGTAMQASTRWRDWSPLRLLPAKFSYQQVPAVSFDSLNLDGLPSGLPWREPRRRCGLGGKMSLTKAITLAIVAIVVLALGAGGGHQYHRHRKMVQEADKAIPYFWQHYYRLNGFYNGIRTLVKKEDYVPENGYNRTEPLPMLKQGESGTYPLEPPMDPVAYKPYPDYTSEAYLENHHAVEPCFLDAEDSVPIPDIYAYPGVPQHMTEPFFGSYDELGIRDDMCFDRFGRLGPYGYGYKESHGGLGPGLQSENQGSDKVYKQTGFIDYAKVDWGDAQQRCFAKNKGRFEDDAASGKKRVNRQAYVLRTWTGYEYEPQQILSLRAMISELSLKSGGEYDVHFLVHVKNNSIPIWASEEVYRETLEANVPKEFWNISTLWSEAQMMMYYPDPFPNNFANMAGAGIHGVYRSAHFALQWFSQQHPEYDHFWNWEMDLRYTGHYYEFNTRIGEWAKEQPRKGLWERGKRFYIPKIHGDYANFTAFVEQETRDKDAYSVNSKQSGPVPVWGPVNDFPNIGMLPAQPGTTPPTSYEEDNYEWGKGEDADLLVFNPLFDTSVTNWVFRLDVTGYDNTLQPPPRRASIITVARLSKRLLNTMHDEVWKMRHTMFPEMWPPSVALHHGLKAAYVPHPVYFDRDWDVEYQNQIFNYPKEEWESPFGWGEHNLLGSSFYYNSGFSGALWRRWLGQAENMEGGRKQEEEGTGRMCLRSTLHHPVKHEKGPTA